MILYTKEGVSRFLWKNFCLTVPKHFVGGPLSMLKKNCVLDKYAKGGGGIAIVFEKFLCHDAENFRSGTLWNLCTLRTQSTFASYNFS